MVSRNYLSEEVKLDVYIDKLDPKAKFPGPSNRPPRAKWLKTVMRAGENIPEYVQYYRTRRDAKAGTNQLGETKYCR